MRLKQYINELFKSDIPLKKKKSGKDFYVEFKVGDITYYFEAAKLATIPGRGTYYDVGFWVAEGDVDLGQSQTRKFNAPRVLAGVLKAFKQFMKERKPDIFQFSSTEWGKGQKSRMGVYEKFAKWIVKNYPYKEVDKDDPTGWRFKKQ